MFHFDKYLQINKCIFSARIINPRTQDPGPPQDQLLKKAAAAKPKGPEKFL